MAEAQQADGTSTQSATGTTGGAAGAGQATEQKPAQQAKTFTAEEHEAEIQRAGDRRVTEAQKKWNADLTAALAAKDKDAATKIAELSTQAEEAAAYATFVETAHAAGIRNLKAAYMVAVGGEYIEHGKFDLKQFQKDNPEFFAPPTTANAGAGAGAATTSGGMNAVIRQAAGRTG